jgi:VWFA-related protein
VSAQTPAPKSTVVAPASPKKPKAPPRSEPDTIRIETTLVNLPVSVLDKNGKYILHLAKKQFHVYEDEVEQEITDFNSNETPFMVALMLDASASARFKLPELQQAALAFIEQLRPQDQVMIVYFSDDVYISSGFTNNREHLRDAVCRVHTGSNTRLYASINHVLTHYLLPLKGRKALVLLTDGVDTASRSIGTIAMLDKVRQADVLVYAVQYNTMVEHKPARKHQGFGPLARGSRYLQALADLSGGWFNQAVTINDINQTFAAIASDLGHQYSLGYYSTNPARDGGFRRIRVRVDKPGATVNTRKGYQVANDTPYKEFKP